MAILLSKEVIDDFVASTLLAFQEIMKMPAECTHNTDTEPCPLSKSALTVLQICEMQLSGCANLDILTKMSNKVLEIVKDYCEEFKPCPDVKAFVAAKIVASLQENLDKFVRAN